MTAADVDPASAGREALAEAARLEAARVYGQTLREVRQQHRAPMALEPLAIPRWARVEQEIIERRVRDEQIITMRDEGSPVAAIAIRFGLSKRRVYEVLDRAS